MTAYGANFDSTGIIYFNQGSNIQPGDPFSIYVANTGDLTNNLILVKQWQDSMLGMQHYKYQQTFQNLRVEAAEYTEHALNGYLVFANGKVSNLANDLNAVPNINEEDALNQLLETLPEDSFAWMYNDLENELKEDLDDSIATYYPSGELLWALDNYKNLTYSIPANKYRLAWKFEIRSINPNYYKAFFVDAQTGAVFRVQELRHSNGPANTLTQGTQTIDTRWFGGTTNKHILHTNDGGRDIQTKYYSSFWGWGMISNIKDGDDNWGNSEQLGTTAHWMTSQAWDFYVSTYDWLGMDGSGSSVRVKADAGFNSTYFEPGNRNDYLIIGDISNNYTAVIDVVGHEFTHGVVHHTAGLVYSDEPGALNESFADIFGVMVEDYTEGGINDWRMGEVANMGNMFTRSLQNPTTAGRHPTTSCGTYATGQPDTYNGTFWYDDECDNGGVHVNSGVQNYWFYLLANGGSGTNDNNLQYNITGIGSLEAAQITIWSLTNILQSGSQFSNARAASILAAVHLFGKCSEQEIQTTNAWAAVVVGEQCTCAVTNISKPLIKNYTRVYPNPVKDAVNILFSGNRSRTLQLFNVSGLLVKDIGETNNERLNLDMSELNDGIYILKVQEANQAYTVKLVKTR